jgi:TonB-dependent starch-binding outer membrane protein SusC
MKRILFLTLLIAILLCSNLLSAQRLVKGSVIDALNQEGIQGAKIQVIDSDLSVQSDQAGNFVIVVPFEKKSLIVTCLGYYKQQIDINNQNFFTVLLKESGSQNRKVSIAYGSQTQAQSTEAISNINISELRNQPVLDINRALQGRSAGLNLKQTSGMPATGLIASIRGNLNPLYIIDGVPKLDEDISIFSKGYDYTENFLGQTQSASSIAGINIFDIESVEVLKDASALSLYGARAANGVILVQTKKGKSDKPEYEFNVYSGLQQIARPLQFMNAKEFKDLVEEARYNDITAFVKNPSVFGKDFDRSLLTLPLEKFNLSNNINTNWVDAITHIAPISNYNFSVKGGNKLSYYSSLGYYDQSGIIIENGVKRLSGRLNLDYIVNPSLSIGTRLMTSYMKNRRSVGDFDYNNVIANSLLSSPFMPVFEKDGSYAAESNYEANYVENGYKLAKEMFPCTHTSSTIASLFGEYQLAQNLKFRTSFSIDNLSLDENYYRSPLLGSVSNFNGKTLQANTTSRTLLNENILTFNFERKKHSFKLLGGFTEQRTTLNTATQTGIGFNTEGGKKTIKDAQEVSNLFSNNSAYNLFSFLSRVNYGFENRFFFTVSMRSDGSSRFSKSKQFGLFPSFAASWNISNKEGWEDSKIGKTLNTLKLRLSYGVLGDQNIGDYKSQTLFEPKKYDGKTAWVLKSIGDPNLTWQSNKMLNAGLDFELTKNRLTGSIDVYHSDKSNLLFETAIPSTNGQSTVLSNSGSEINQGIELNLATVLLKNAKLKWESQFNISYNQSKLKTDAEPTLIYADIEVPATHILQNDKPIGSIVAVKYLGVNPQTGEYEYEDFNKDGIIDNQDAQIVGNGVPTWFGGWSNHFSYGKIDLSCFFRFSGGNKILNLFRDETENLGWSNDGGLLSVYANNSTAVINRWKKPGDITEFGKASFINKNFIRNSTRVLEDGSFFRLQNVTLGYNFSFLKNKIKSRIYITAQNLYVLTNYKGFDPEVSSTGNKTLQTVGVDYAAYPQAHTFILGGSFRF